MSAYWKICVEEALSDCGIAAAPEQIERLTDMLTNAGEMEREASGAYEQNRPSLTPKPKQGWSQPYCTGGRYYRDGGPPDENWSIQDKDSGQHFYFNSKSAAQKFYDMNHP